MTQNSFQLLTSAVSDRGLSEKRPQNEDSYIEMPERGLFAVADGVGGAQAGDVASQMAVELLGEAFTNFREGDVEELMHEAISRGNGAIYQMSHDLPQLSTMATTIVALQISGNIATIGHVGDSRLYRLDSRGNLFRETQDHSVVEEEVRAGRMTPEQAENHPSKNVISRALGAESTVEIDMKTIMFEPNTTFLLCSDGITRHITDVEIRELLSLPHPPVVICQEMKEICYERGAEDNLTAVIVRIAGDAVQTPTEIEETTVATARQNTVENFAYAQTNQNEYDEIPTQNLQFPEGISNQHLYQDVSASAAETVPTNTNSMQISANAQQPDTIILEKEDNPYDYDERSSGAGVFSKVFPFILGLIFGCLIGAAGYYLTSGFFTKEEEKPTEIKKMESPNIPFTTFENNRRLADSDPQKLITAQGALADDAEDYFLIGRAYINLGNYQSAKKSLEEAKKLLKDYNGEHKSTLNNEIAYAYAIAQNEAAQKTFETEKVNSGGKATNTNTAEK